MNIANEVEKAMAVYSDVLKERLKDAVDVLNELQKKRDICDNDGSAERLSLTLMLVNRLANGEPLTPITKSDFVGAVCDRYPSLIKSENGKISDTKRVVFHDQSRIMSTKTANSFMDAYKYDRVNDLVISVVDQLYPIKLPYTVGEKYEVFGSTVSFGDGEPDLIELDYLKTPDGLLVSLNRFYKNVNGRITAITDEAFTRYRSFGTVDLSNHWIRFKPFVNGDTETTVLMFATKVIVSNSCIRIPYLYRLIFTRPAPKTSDSENFSMIDYKTFTLDSITVDLNGSAEYTSNIDDVVRVTDIHHVQYMLDKCQYSDHIKNKGMISLIKDIIARVPDKETK